MVRTQIQLKTEQARVLKKMALVRRESVSNLIRKAVDDLSRKHDAYLAEAFGNKNLH